MSKRVLVTGGAGYIGSHACRALARAGYTPIVYDDLSAGNAWAVKWGPLVRGSILDRDLLKQTLARYRPVAVMHFAALAYVGESVYKPEKYYEANVWGTFNVLEAMRDENVRDIVFSSTCATYGQPKAIPIREDEVQRPVNPYGFTKMIAEGMLRDFRAAHDFRTICLRYFNAAGASPEGDIGEAHEPETHLIPLVLDVALGKRAEIKVFGSDYATRDGTCERDYVHVCDIADAHVKALELLPAPIAQHEFNLGTGNGYSVLEIVQECRKVTRRRISVALEPRRSGDPATLVADASAASNVLGWRPHHSDLPSIIESAWSWSKRFGDEKMLAVVHR